jgi:hypothetical protein
MADLRDSVSIEAKVNAPGAGATLATLPAVPQAGKYRFRMMHYTSGTVAEVDNDNVQLSIGGVVRETLTTGQHMTESDYMLDGVSAVVLKNVSASTAGSVYHVKMTVTPILNPNEY